MRVRDVVLLSLLHIGLPGLGQQPAVDDSNSQILQTAPDTARQSTQTLTEQTPAQSSKSAPDLTPGSGGKLSQTQMQQLLHVVAEKDLENDKRQRDYTYIERQVENKLDGQGRTKSTEIKTYEVLEIYGEQVERLIEKDDKPLNPKEVLR